MSARWLVVLVMLIGLSASGRDATGARGRDETATEPTATMAWGKPLAGGAISVLFVAPRFTLRDVVELSDRLEITPDAAPVRDARGSGSSESAAGVFAGLDRPHDVIAVGNIDPAILPETVWDRILDQVKTGTGLVVANLRGPAPSRVRALLDSTVPASESAAAIVHGVGESLTPEWPSNLAFVKTQQHGQGRVVFLDYPNERPFTHFLVPGLSDPAHARTEYFETYLSLVARALRWSAGRDPSIWVTSVENAGPKGPAEDEIPPDLPEEYIETIRDGVARPLFDTFVVHLNQPADRTYCVQARVRQPDRGMTVTFPDMPRLEKGSDSYVINLRIGPGRALLDLWLLDGKRTVEWHTEAIETVGWPDISDVAYSKGALLPNDTLTVSLTIQPDYARPRPCTFYVRAVDSLGRKVSEAWQAVPPEGGEARVTLGFADLIANLVKVEVFAADVPPPHVSRWVLDRAPYTFMYLPVRTPRPLNQLSFVVEDPVPFEYNARKFMDTLAHLGVDSALVPPTAEGRFYLADTNLRSIPELVHYIPDSIENGNIQKPCFSSTDYRNAEALRLGDLLPGFWAVGTNVYSLGRGNCLTVGEENVCQSPTCLEGFRSALREQYRDLASLSRSWGRTCGAWDVVVPATREEAAASGRYAPWLDFRRYMDRAFCDMHLHARDAIRRLDTGARVGFRARSGEQATLGYDWSLLGSELNGLVVPADPLVVEKVRSYRPAESFSAIMPETNGDTLLQPAFARWLPWYQVLHGFQGCWLPFTYGTAEPQLNSSSSILAIEPDGQPSRSLKEMASSIEVLKTGLDALLLSTARASAEIAVYDSQASDYLCQANPNLRVRTTTSQRAVIHLLESGGFPYDFVSPVQVLAGKLEPYALVILPGVVAMDDAEIEALQHYHADGGRVLADVLPGQYDGHGVLRAGAEFKEVFGVQSAENTATAQQSAERVKIKIGKMDVPQDIGPITATAPLVVTDAVAGGETGGSPVWITKGNGPGFTALLNHAFPSYPSSVDEDNRFRVLFEILLTSANVKPLARVEASESSLFTGECLKGCYGDAAIIAILRDSGASAKDASQKPLKLTMPCDKNKFLYDLVHPGRPVRKDRIRAKLRPGEAAVFSQLSYEVEQVSVVTLDRVEAGKRLPIRILIKAKNTVPGMHLVNITLVHGSHRRISHYETNVTCVSGEGRLFIPLALDEPTGFYTIVAKDILSGVCGESWVWIDPHIAELK